MTNAVKYTTAEERKKAFEDFCIARRCKDCELYEVIIPYTDCKDYWLELEAQEDD